MIPEVGRTRHRRGIAGALADGAGAAPIDDASGHSALVAYHSYVVGLLSSVPAIRTATNHYVASIAARCPGVLAPLALLPPGSANQGAVLAVVAQLGDDLGTASHEALRGQLSKLATALAPLRSSNPQTGHTIRAYLTAQRRCCGSSQATFAGPAGVRRFSRAADAAWDAPVARQGRSSGVRPGESVRCL